MATTRQTSASGAKCPNHGVVLLNIGEGRRKQCPISTAIFEVDEDTASEQMTYDKYGNVCKTYTITGEEA